MKKILITAIIFILLLILTVSIFLNYLEIRLNEYLDYIAISMESFIGIEVKNLEIERVIKKSPKEIIILVKWDNNSAFVSIKDWMIRRAHDEIEIRLFDNKHRIKFYE